MILTTMATTIHRMFYCFCILAASALCVGVFADGGGQVSVEGRSFDRGNFFDMTKPAFRKGQVNFQKGWLGIFMENAEGKGILVKGTTKGSPADKAGLKAGDIITKLNGETTVGVDNLNLVKFKKTVEAIGVGGVPEITVLRDNSEVVVEPRLLRKLLKNEKALRPSFIPKTHSEHTGTTTSCIDFAVRNEKYRDVLYATLQRIGEEIYVREGFQSEAETNPFRLSLVNYLMQRPMEAEKIGQAVSEGFFRKDAEAQIGFAAELLDIKPNNVKSPSPDSSCEKEGERKAALASGEPIASPSPKTEVPDTLQQRLQSVIDTLLSSASCARGAFRNLSREEFDFLYQHTQKIWMPDRKIEPDNLARVLELSRKADLARLFEAALPLLDKLAAVCPGEGADKRISAELSLQPFSLPIPVLPVNQKVPSKEEERCPDGDRVPSAPPAASGAGGKEQAKDSDGCKGFAGDILFVQDTDIGKIVVGGTGTSYYYDDAAVIVDLGGDDYYFNNAGSSGKDAPVSVCIDFSGDDVYDAAGQFAQGTGRFGVGILMDFGGDDTYTGKDFCQGACLFGVGLLADYGGDDSYSGNAVSQGAGFFGAGLLSDLHGNDVYFSRLFSQGIGFTRGLGAIVDFEGNDFYFAGGKYPDFRDTERSFQSMSQGMGMGIRPEETVIGASGGIGLLLDLKGADRYHGDYFSQGSGYYYSLGMLCDKEGHDRYYAGRYAQGAGIHSAIGLLEDSSGDDAYECSFGVSQGCGHDAGIGFLIDGSGDDAYRSKTSSQGVGLEKGIGVLADFSGNDVYDANDRSQGASCPSTNEEMPGMGMLFDNEGDRDVFHDAIPEDMLFYRTSWGIVLNKK